MCLVLDARPGEFICRGVYPSNISGCLILSVIICFGRDDSMVIF